MPKTRLTIAAIVCIACLGGALAATAVAQSQRFPDVPPDHYAYEAVEWAAEAGVTVGYGDGTFKPEEPLGRWHALVFMERYYDEILQAEQSEDFTRADMMVVLKAMNDGLDIATLTLEQPAPPVYPSYEAAVTAANAWADQMEAIIGGGAQLEDWQEVIPLAAEKAELWAGHDLIADRIRNEALLMSRTGDPIISERLSDITEAKFYLAAISYSLAAGASQAAQASGVSESDAASAAAWAAVGARLARVATPPNSLYASHLAFWCAGCVIGGHDRFHDDDQDEFNWIYPSRDKAGEARNAYFELAS